MSAKVAILPARVSDLEEILSIQREAFMQEAVRGGDFGIAPLCQTLESITADIDTHTILKATIDGIIKGTVRAREQGDGECWIGRLAVKPDSQGKGLGQRLLADMEACFTESSSYVIYTDPAEEKNIGLYRSAGYVLTGEIIPDPASGFKLVKLIKEKPKR